MRRLLSWFCNEKSFMKKTLSCLTALLLVTVFFPAAAEENAGQAAGPAGCWYGELLGFPADLIHRKPSLAERRGRVKDRIPHLAVELLPELAEMVRLLDIPGDSLVKQHRIGDLAAIHAPQRQPLRHSAARYAESGRERHCKGMVDELVEIDVVDLMVQVGRIAAVADPPQEFPGKALRRFSGVKDMLARLAVRRHHDAVVHHLAPS